MAEASNMLLTINQSGTDRYTTIDTASILFCPRLADGTIQRDHTCACRRGRSAFIFSM